MNGDSAWFPTTYDGYFVNRQGEVRGPRGKTLKPKMVGYKRSYPAVTIREKVIYVHYLVCSTFHGPRPSPEYQVAHWNGVPTDNCPENLRWATQSENQRDSVRHGTCRMLRYVQPRGEASPTAKLTQHQVDRMRALYARGALTQEQIGAMFGIGKSQASNILGGRHWRTQAS